LRLVFVGKFEEGIRLREEPRKRFVRASRRRRRFHFAAT
jgi:hypothetical protein